MPSDLAPRRHLELIQQTEDDFSFEGLQVELQRLQHQLEEHGKSLFGGEHPTHHQSPRVVETIPTAVLAKPPRPEKHSQQQDRGMVALKTTHHTKPSRHYNNKMSKNERNLKEENQNLKKQLAEEREELRRLRALKSVTEEKMTSRMAQLEERLKLLLLNETKLEKRRAADTEGWRAELTALRKRVQSAEQRQRKIIVVSSVKDEDHRQKVISRHRKLEKLCQSNTNSGKKDARKQPAIKEKTESGGRRREEQVGQRLSTDEDAGFERVLQQEGLEQCMGQLSEELNALKSALGNLEQQFYR
jgi:hypothetical protein